MRVSNYIRNLDTLTESSTTEEIAQAYIKGKRINTITRETGIEVATLYQKLANLVDEPIFPEIKNTFLNLVEKVPFTNVKASLVQYTTTKTTLIDCTKKHQIPRKILEMWIAVYKDQLGTLYDDFHRVKLKNRKRSQRDCEEDKSTLETAIEKKMFKGFPRKNTRSKFKELLCKNKFNSYSVEEYIQLAKAEGIEITK